MGLMDYAVLPPDGTYRWFSQPVLRIVKFRCKTVHVKIGLESIKCSYHKVVFCMVGGAGVWGALKRLDMWRECPSR
jgi:hypothetical protein